jgi:hypothetical protein
MRGVIYHTAPRAQSLEFIASARANLSKDRIEAAEKIARAGFLNFARAK